MKLKIKKGDTVVVTAGRNQKKTGTQSERWDKGKRGRVLEIYPDTMRVLVEGANIRKVHQKPNAAHPQGGIIERELPIHYSKVQIVDSDGNPTRIGIRINEDGTKTRVAKTNGKEL